MILVYTMGKVGSTSIYESILKAGFECYHIHDLEHPTTNQEKYVKDDFRPKKVISLTRDIVARNISNFFQNLNNKSRPWYTLPGQDLTEAFYKIDIKHHLAPQHWFDNQIKKFLNVDIYEHKIDKHIQIKKLLVMRVENLDFSVVSKFMGAKLKVVNTNLSENKGYRDQYKKFLETPIREDYLNLMYSCKYMRHFYSSEEINAFFKRHRKI